MGSAPRWRTQTRFFSPTVDEVLRTAPCEVMVVTYPEGVLEDERGMMVVMKAIVIGCGRVGSTLARTLADEGWEVTVVELEEENLVAARPGLAPPARARPRHGREGARGGRRRGRRRRSSPRPTATTPTW